MYVWLASQMVLVNEMKTKNSKTWYKFFFVCKDNKTGYFKVGNLFRFETSILLFVLFLSAKKSIINRKLLWLNYLISSSIVLLPVNAKVELPTRSCRMCTFYLNLTWLWKTDTYNSIKMAQWTLNTYLQRVCTVEILKD